MPILVRAMALLALLLLPVAAARAAPPFPSVWFTPASASPDYLDLFRKPELWARARAKIQVFHFAPAQLDGRDTGVGKTYSDVLAVDAFRKLRAWGMQTAIGAPAVKDWDCAGAKAEAYTAREIAAVAKGGGHVDWVVMDEPLAAGAGISRKSACRLSTDQVAAEVATYVHDLSTNPEVLAGGPAPQFADIEAYPSTGIDQMEQFVAAMEAHGFHPAGFFIDIAYRFVEQHPENDARMPADLRHLRDFLHARKIPFGVVFWSGWDPVGSDEAYYQRVIKWATYMHRTLGEPDASAFSSWVLRCDGKAVGGDLACTRKNMGCAPEDILCGKKSIPINLPDNDPKVFSHTRLIDQSLAILRGP